MHGDGFLDLVEVDRSTNPCQWKVWLGSRSGRGFMLWSTPPGSSLCSIQTKHPPYLDLRDDRNNPKSIEGCTKRATLDINGDGIPDYVEVDEQYYEQTLRREPPESQSWGFSGCWRVYLGYGPTVAPDGTVQPGGFHPWICWRVSDTFSYPGKGFAREWILYGYNGYTWESWTVTYTALIDLNGDGLLDYVDADYANYTPPTNGLEAAWFVGYNKGRCSWPDQTEDCGFTPALGEARSLPPPPSYP